MAQVPTSTTTLEYDVLQRNYPKIVSAVKGTPKSIARSLFAKSLLTQEEVQEINDPRATKDEAAEIISQAVLDRSRYSDKQAFYIFLEALAEEGDYTKELRNTLFQETVASQLRSECPKLNILMIGATGTGKSTLVNNLLGKNLAAVGGGLESETKTVTKYEGKVQEVSVCIYDSPGLFDVEEGHDDAAHLAEVKEYLPDVHVFIFCFDMSQKRFNTPARDVFEKYTDIGVDWKRTVIALTFADNVPIPTSMKSSPEDISDHFDKRTHDWRQALTQALAEAGGSVCEIHPTTDDPKAKLMNGKSWFNPIWISVLKVLSAPAMTRFIEANRNMKLDILTHDSTLTEPSAPKRTRTADSSAATTSPSPKRARTADSSSATSHPPKRTLITSNYTATNSPAATNREYLDTEAYAPTPTYTPPANTTHQPLRFSMKEEEQQEMNRIVEEKVDAAVRERMPKLAPLVDRGIVDKPSGGGFVDAVVRGATWLKDTIVDGVKAAGNAVKTAVGNFFSLFS